MGKSQHGGPRPGAGRKPLNHTQPTRRVSAAVTLADWQYLKRLGGGNVSEGVRRAVAYHRGERR